MTQDSKILSKIRKLLAMANDPGASENEVMVASRKAQKLMMEHNITESNIQLNLSDFGADDILDNNEVGYEKESFARGILHSLAEQYMCKLLILTGYRNSVRGYRIVGELGNVELVKESYTIVVEKFRSLAEPRYKEYYKKTKAEVKELLGYWDAKHAEKMGMIQPRRVWIPSYLLGCAKGLQEQIEQETNDNLTEVEKKSKYALIVRKHTDMINEFIKEEYGKLGECKTKTSKIFGGAYHEGRADGRTGTRTKMIG